MDRGILSKTAVELHVKITECKIGGPQVSLAGTSYKMENQFHPILGAKSMSLLAVCNWIASQCKP